MDDDGGSIRSWLDSLKAGWAARFAAAFEEVGVEDCVDLGDLDEELQAQLEDELKKAGAKGVQLKKIKEAISSVVQPTQAARANLKEIQANSDGTASSTADSLLLSESRSGAVPADTGKRFMAFISHHKAATAMEGRFIKTELERLTGRQCFLDSDDLYDLGSLLEHVRESDALVILLTESVFTRPWCLLELYTALESRTPIVALNCAGKGYDFESASNFMVHLDTQLDDANPGACALLRQEGVDPERVAHALATTLPKMIARSFDSCASRNVITGSLMDLVDALRNAAPVDIEPPFEQWLAARAAAPAPTRPHGAPPSVPSSSQKGLPVVSGARCPPGVPKLPSGYIARAAILEAVKQRVLPDAAAAAVSVFGMGGSGKTVVASALARDGELLSKFSLLAFVSVGQDPAIRDLQKTIYGQLTGTAMDASLVADQEIALALRKTAEGKNVLLILDDVWTQEQEMALNCLDSRTMSKSIITTRMKGLIPGHEEVELGVLDRDTAVRLLYECAGLSVQPPYSKLAFDAAELCGKLPLVLSIAGGMLESHGSIDDDFVKLLSEDNREVLREGEFGDINVQIEDRLINASLSSIQSSEKAQIKALFQWFAVFPVRSLSRDDNYAMSLPLHDCRKTCLFHSQCWTCSRRWSLGRA